MTTAQTCSAPSCGRAAVVHVQDHWFCARCAPRGEVQSTGTAESLFEQALALWGPRVRLEKLEEECLELALAIRHYLNGRPSHVWEVVRESVDASIMLQQLPLILKSVGVDNYDVTAAGHRVHQLTHLANVMAKVQAEKETK